MKRERGSVSIVVAAIVLLALVLSVGVADVARVLVARSHARTAADAAALAAAQELALPSGADPADVAADYAERNDAILTDCLCDAGTLDATVTVSIVVDGFLLVAAPGPSRPGRARSWGCQAYQLPTSQVAEPITPTTRRRRSLEPGPTSSTVTPSRRRAGLV